MNLDQAVWSQSNSADYFLKPQKSWIGEIRKHGPHQEKFTWKSIESF